VLDLTRTGKVAMPRQVIGQVIDVPVIAGRMRR
jgi:hypothetical protein